MGAGDAVSPATLLTCSRIMLDMESQIASPMTLLIFNNGELVTLEVLLVGGYTGPVLKALEVVGEGHDQPDVHNTGHMMRNWIMLGTIKENKAALPKVILFTNKIMMSVMPFVLDHFLQHGRFYYIPKASISLPIVLTTGGLVNLSNADITFRSLFNFHKELLFIHKEFLMKAEP
ncbi:hypothetical protein QJS10_CPB15g01282 [Acorus calamus]|uniref:Uncharacterized protein n=1 Tax=Acorus calamus TaxID=4465 RepID=A0AAV9D406_ACOCL|nr:hypothetical protein QJS10_CPB15g01282 [Acorus calamus]